MRPPARAGATGWVTSWSVAGLAALLLVAACSVPTDADFYPPLTDPPFTVTAVALPQPPDQPQPVNPTITLTLSDFPDPATAQFPAVQLGLRGQAIEFLLELSLARRQLVLRPRRQLLPENDYFVSLTKEVQALSGQPLDPPLAVRFHTGSFVAPDAAPEPAVSLSQLLTDPAGLSARCALAGCHRAPAADGQLATFLTTTRARGSFEGLLLVQPGAPERSYLLRKIIAGGGVARTSGAPMPPAGAPLDPSLLHALELWIRQGAH